MNVLNLQDLEGKIKGCQRCGLAVYRQNIVFGEGNPKARLMLIGEGPGADEDRLGRPFVGAAGQLLDKILAAINTTREEVYIANIVKCRPPGNRVPVKPEADACLPWLHRQIEVIDPRVIVLLGATALQYLTGSRAGITKMRGKWLKWEGIKVMPTYHPAALLRDPSKKRPLWEDFQKIQEEYQKALQEKVKEESQERPVVWRTLFDELDEV